MATAAMTQKPKGRRLLWWLLAFILILPVLCVTFYFWPGIFVGAVRRVSELRLGVSNHQVVLGKYKVHFLVAGEGKPLVLVHGLGGRSEDWLSLIPELKRGGYKVYAPDLLGFGQTDKPDADYSIALQSELVRQFLDSQNLAKPDIAGWSMGGWVSLKLAADHPDRVHRLILLDSAGTKFEAVNAGALRPKTEPELAHMMEILTPHPKPIPGFYARYVLRILAEQDWVVERALRSMEQGNDLMDGKMASVKSPVLLVWGKQDVLTPPSIGEQMQREMPQSVLHVVDGCGHLAPVECSNRVTRSMVSFLGAEPPLAPGRQEIAAEK